ncbi:MAG: hypothetical protein ACLFQK_11265, partial [Fibrobacterota bacterium]
MTELIKRYPVLKPLEADIESMVEMVSYTFRNEGKLLLAGNGGSAADCEHISGEMLKVFIDRGGIDEKMKARLISDSSDEGKILASGIERGFPAIPLTSFISLTTAYAKANGQEIDLPDVPSRPSGYGQWVSDAIKWGDPDFVSYMSHVVSHLQVYRSRLGELPILFDDPDNVVVVDNIRDYIVQGSIIYMELGNLL